MKERKITLRTEEIYKDIDRLSYKLADTAVEDSKAKDKVSSDSEDNLDGAILSRLMNYRNAMLRKRLSFCLKKTTITEADNTDPLEEELVFELMVEDSFDDNNLPIAANLMHDYLVRSVLFEWYTKIGSNFGATLASDLDEIESQLLGCFREQFLSGAPYPKYPNYYYR